MMDGDDDTQSCWVLANLYQNLPGTTVHLEVMKTTPVSIPM